jgi:hypothetical protein
MTNQWKPIGDKWPQPAMVMVSGVKDGCAVSHKYGHDIALESLHPMPPGVTPEQQAVLRRAEEQNEVRRSTLHNTAGYYNSNNYYSACENTNRAVHIMLISQQPPDAVKELREAWNALQHNGYDDGRVMQMETVITAIEKAQKS